MDNGNGLKYYKGDILEFGYKNKYLIGKFIKISKQKDYIIHVQVNGKQIYTIYHSQVTKVIKQKGK